jgi:hypothetical protein
MFFFIRNQGKTDNEREIKEEERYEIRKSLTHLN